MFIFVSTFATIIVLGVLLFTKKCKKYGGRNFNFDLINHLYTDDILNIKNNMLPSHTNNIFIISTNGNVEDIRKKYRMLKEVINTINDILLIEIESTGGNTSEFAAATSIIMTLCKSFNVHVFIKNIAVSGGYMMAAPAHKIIADRFSIIGNVGVIQGNLNFHKLITRLGIEHIQITNGREKTLGTLNPFNNIGDSEKNKMFEKGKIVHKQFIELVKRYRPYATNFEESQTYTSIEAQENGLIDDIMSYDDYIQNYIDKGYNVIEVKDKYKDQLNIADIVKIFVNLLS